MQKSEDSLFFSQNENNKTLKKFSESDILFKTANQQDFSLLMNKRGISKNGKNK